MPLTFFPPHDSTRCVSWKEINDFGVAGRRKKFMVAVSIFHPSLFTAARCFNFERLNYHANNVKLFLSNRFFITKREWEGAVYKTRKRRQRPVAVPVRPFFLFLFEEVEVEKKKRRTENADRHRFGLLLLFLSGFKISAIREKPPSPSPPRPWQLCS